MRIADGKGRGRYASVDHEGRLEVHAAVLANIAHASHQGDAYAIIGKHTIQSTDTTENLIFIQNDNDDVHIHIETFALVAKTTNGVLFTGMMDPTRTSGGASKTPVQMNRQSARESDITVYDNSSNDLVLGVTVAEEFLERRIGTTGASLCDTKGSIIIGPGDTFCFRVYGTSGDLVTFNAFVYEADVQFNL